MTAAGCCATRSRLRVVGRGLGWLSPLAPGALIVLMPKCPACVAGYVALATGLGVSTGVAASAQIGVYVALGATVLFVAWRAIGLVRKLRTRGRSDGAGRAGG